MGTNNTIALRRFANDIYERARHDADATVGVVLFTDPVSGGKGVLHNVSGDKREAGLVLLRLASELLKEQGVIDENGAPVIAPTAEMPSAEAP